jgi:hypothetical protein
VALVALLTVGLMAAPAEQAPATSDLTRPRRLPRPGSVAGRPT